MDGINNNNVIPIQGFKEYNQADRGGLILQTNESSLGPYQVSARVPTFNIFDRMVTKCD